MYKYLDAAALKGITITSISNEKFGPSSDTEGLIGQEREVYIRTSENKTYCMFHSQDCCESVYVKKIEGRIESLIGKEILSCKEEVFNEGWAGFFNDKEDLTDSWTITVYTFQTIDSEVKIIWLGVSNGYYSESVQIEEVE